MSIESGTQLGKYRIVSKLGAGGMADVFEAEDTMLGRRVALKVLPPEFARDATRAQRFQLEVRHAAALEHPGIVTVYDVGSDAGLHYYAMTLLPGGDLKCRIRDKQLSLEQTLGVIRQVAQALGHAHAKGFVHRDVKPENILFDAHGHPVLTDLGIARLMNAGARMTGTGMSIGTPHYMSPEQARGRAVDGRSDLYSLGIVLYEALSGEVPFDAEDSTAVGIKHITEPVPRLVAGLAPYQGLIDRLLEKEPGQRYQSAEELIVDIYALAGRGATRGLPRETSNVTAHTQRTTVMHSVEAPPPIERKLSSLPQLWAVGGGVVAMLGFVFWNARQPEPVRVTEGSTLQTRFAAESAHPAGTRSAAMPVGALASTSAEPNDPEQLYWTSAITGNTREEYALYLKQYPNGRYAAEAQRRIEDQGRDEAQGQEQGARREEEQAQAAANRDEDQRAKAAPQGFNRDRLDAPSMRIGDAYTFETIDHVDPRLNNVTTREVTDVSAVEVTMKYTNAKSGYARMLTYDASLNLLSTRSRNNEGSDFRPALRYFSFPGRVGDTWTAASTETNTKTGKTRAHAFKGRIEGIETVTVPAGTFDVWKISIESEVRDDSKTLFGRDVSWYSPQIRRTVKSEIESGDGVTGAMGRRTVSLLSYSIRP